MERNKAGATAQPQAEERYQYREFTEENVAIALWMYRPDARPGDDWRGVDIGTKDRWRKEARSFLRYFFTVVPASAQVAQEGGDEPNEHGLQLPRVLRQTPAENVTEAAEGVAASRTTQDIVAELRDKAHVMRCSQGDKVKDSIVRRQLCDFLPPWLDRTVARLQEQEVRIAVLQGQLYDSRMAASEWKAENESLRKTLERVRRRETVTLPAVITNMRWLTGLMQPYLTLRRERYDSPRASGTRPNDDIPR